MNKKFKFYTSACSLHNGNFLGPLGFEGTKEYDEANVVLFGGGADIDPATYGEKPSIHTSASPATEKIERADFMRAKKDGKVMVGICRGAQLLTAMAGGKLIQDVTGHSGFHTMTTFDGIEVKTNSLHHQMVNPYAIKNKHDYKILAWSTKRRSSRYLGAGDKSVYLPWDFKEIEAVAFPKIKAIGFQFHPEMMFGSKDYDPVMTWTQNIFMKFFNGELNF